MFFLYKTKDNHINSTKPNTINCHRKPYTPFKMNLYLFELQHISSTYSDVFCYFSYFM